MKLNLTNYPLATSDGNESYLGITAGGAVRFFPKPTGGGGGGSPGGLDTQLQFNDGGAFGGDAGLTYNKTTDTLTVGTLTGPNAGPFGQRAAHVWSFFNTSTAFPAIDLTAGSGIILGAALPLSWNSASFTNSGAPDLSLWRDAPDMLALRRGTNAQTARVYETFTDNLNRRNIEITGEQIKWHGLGTAAYSHAAGLLLKYDGSVTLEVREGDDSGYLNLRAYTLTSKWWQAEDGGVHIGGGGYGSGVGLWTSYIITWGATGISDPDLQLQRGGTKQLELTDASTGGAGLLLREMTAPSAPASNKGVLYLEDNGSGKTRLMVRFPTGAAQQIAIEP